MASLDDSICTKEELKLFKTKFTQIIKETFFADKQPNYHAVVIRNCNGTGSWSFSDATIDYDLPRKFPASMLYFNGYTEIRKCVKECLEEHEQTKTTERLKMEQMVKKYINRVMTTKHEQCLQHLLQDKNLTEEKIKCILAIHYFKPLSKDGIYFVDKCQGCKSCPCCQEDLKADMKETSFGHRSVWHGQADIVIQKSIVKIDVDDVAKLSLHDEESDDLDCSNIVEVKTEETKVKPKSSSQAIAQTIVNAFVEAGMNKSLFDKFIPSFLATEKNIRIILFNCKLDKLLFSDEFPIWDNNCTLSLRTLTFVWLTLNTFMNKLDKNAKHFIARTPVSRFKDVVGDSYKIYLNEVSRPIKKVPKESAESKYVYENEDMAVICEVQMKVIKITTEDSEEENQQPKNDSS